MNQVELHPLFNQEALIRTHRRLGIATQAWSPLGAVLIYDAASPEKARHVPADPVITELAARYGKSPAQIILRWHVQRDVAVIPKSVHPERMRENIAIFDFSLAEEDGNSASGCRNPGRARPGACRKKYLSCGSRPIGAA